MNIITADGSMTGTAMLDHRTGATLVGGPASRYLRVVRCDGRPDVRRDERRIARAHVRPNYAARRLGALFLALASVMAGTWLVGEVAVGQPASAAAPGVDGDAGVSAVSDAARPDVLVARAGDTLWSIADAHRGDVSRDRFVDALVELNGGTTSIEIGQAVRLP